MQAFRKFKFFNRFHCMKVYLYLKLYHNFRSLNDMKHIAALEKRFSKDCGQTGSGAGGSKPPGEPKKT